MPFCLSIPHFLSHTSIFYQRKKKYSFYFRLLPLMHLSSKNLKVVVTYINKLAGFFEESKIYLIKNNYFLYFHLSHPNYL
ncbi:hypothetical protein Mgra_00001194 [Meloidogyne graminicola]|uniref:Uncharacterized protein n=1 Tax=Meloidogyne graminicola TaxID=189291 RepID=A0A8T0A2F9_9BILA|nr:hypothetical protein Mgra_00001194 [Meloidogyne graminicola]